MISFYDIHNLGCGNPKGPYMSLINFTNSSFTVSYLCIIQYLVRGNTFSSLCWAVLPVVYFLQDTKLPFATLLLCFHRNPHLRKEKWAADKLTHVTLHKSPLETHYSWNKGHTLTLLNIMVEFHSCSRVTFWNSILLGRLRGDPYS